MTADSQPTLQILIISPSQVDRSAYRKLLIQGLSQPVRILEATPGREAFEVLETEKPDCIFVDSGPCSDCKESSFTAELKARRRHIGVPIMFLRNGAPQETKCSFQKSGIHCTTSEEVRLQGFQKALEDTMEQHGVVEQVFKAQETEWKKSVLLEKLVNQLRSARRDLLEEHRLNHALLSSLTSILIGLNGENRISYWNKIAEKLFHMPAEEVLGKPLEEIGIIWTWDDIENGMDECRRTRQTIRLLDIPYRLASGKTGLLGFTVNWLDTHKDDPQQLLLLGADITERRALEAKQQQTQKLESVGALAAGIAHELNTPIQYVGDAARFLKGAFDDAWGCIERIKPLARSLPADLVQDLNKTFQDADLDYLGEEIPKAIDQAIMGMSQMAKIVHAMREYSHPGGAKTLININQTIENTLVVGRGQWKQIAEIETFFAPDLPEVLAVASDIQQVVLNLLVNAAHAIDDARDKESGELGHITISTLLRDQWVEINITDTGAGIPDSIKDKVFDPFFTTKEIGKGTGQGLSITHDIIVKKHAGKISFDSVAGQGTLFQIHLPVKEITDAAPQ